MADKIKAFFRQKKAEAKFKTAGGGQKLGDSSKSSQPATQQGKSQGKLHAKTIHSKPQPCDLMVFRSKSG